MSETIYTYGLLHNGNIVNIIDSTRLLSVSEVQAENPEITGITLLGVN